MYHMFQRPKNESLGTTHSLLLTEADLQVLLNHSVPQEFQGTGYFAVRIDATVLNEVQVVLELFKEDGNRTWSQRTKSWCHFEHDGDILYVLVVYYDHSHNGFCKTISFVVDGPNSTEMDLAISDLVIIRYYWKANFKPISFDPKQYPESRLPSYFKRRLAPKLSNTGRGPVGAPRHALKEVIEETPASLIRANPSFQISSVRQIKTAKNSMKNERFGGDKLQYILDSRIVESHFYQSWDFRPEARLVKRQVHFVTRKYQLDLVAKYCFGPASTSVDLDVKFNLTNAYTVVLTCRLPGIFHKERRTPFVLIGMTALSEKKDAAVFEEVALWLHSQMIRRGVQIKNTDVSRNLKIKTDDEAALYKPFIDVFEAPHTLCCNHFAKSCDRNMAKLRASQSLSQAWQRRIFGDIDRESNTYTRGTVDEETLEEMLKHVREFDRADENPEVLKFLTESRNGIKKLHAKMGPAIRRIFGIYPNLPHTNDVEGVNNLLGLEAGKKLQQCELIERLDNLLQSKCEDICRALMELGDYSVIDNELLIRKAERTNKNVMEKKFKKFFGSDPDPEKTLSVWKATVDDLSENDVDLIDIYQQRALSLLQDRSKTTKAVAARSESIRYFERRAGPRFMLLPGL
ncbi:uncharacterized protein LOC129598244 [Paramacrobiotus metropolitanus]|uniref:uncharacterized protein LOC129598244 n=1 Tax=Paramacrobiotus metropolitanus TaxID=2943436 RepID=UPI00244593BA|nr:uncharacterized protein LOC129598244 [Paramacrobiotus metropolitanus]